MTGGVALATVATQPKNTERLQNVHKPDRTQRQKLFLAAITMEKSRGAYCIQTEVVVFGARERRKKKKKAEVSKSNKPCVCIHITHY